MTNQPEFDLFPGPPSTDETELAILKAFLLHHPEETFISTPDCLAHLGWPVTSSNKRKLRQLAEKSDADIISLPGKAGFKHRTRCSTTEIKTAARSNISQGRKMVRKGIKMLRKSHLDLS